MEISFRRDISANSMVIENISGFSKNNFKVKMLMSNNIVMLLKFNYEYINGHTNLIYDISSKQTMAAVLETEKLSYEMLAAFVSSLKNLADSLEEYLLDAKNIILRKEYIFMNPVSNKFCYCYDPYYDGDFKSDLGNVFDDFLSAVDYDEPEAVKLVYDLHRECHKENFTADSMAAVMLEGNNPAAAFRLKDNQSEKRKNDSVFSGFAGAGTGAGALSGADFETGSAYGNPDDMLPDGTAAYNTADIMRELTDDGSDSAGFFRKLSAYLKGKSALDVVEDIDSGRIGKKIKETRPLPSHNKKTAQRRNKIPKDTYGSADDESQDLFDARKKEGETEQEQFEAKHFTRRQAPEAEPYNNEEKFCRRYLVGMNRQLGTVIEIDRFPFTVGKADRQTDAVISSPAVSDMHCRIHENIPGEEYFFEDLNSEGGSRINNVKLDPYKKAVLMPGDIVMIADEEYCFR